MLPLAADLREIVEAVEIRSTDSFSVAGENFQMPPTESGKGAVISQLAKTLYQRMYCRPQGSQVGTGADRRAARVFVEHLSNENCGEGTWDPSWVVRALESDGTLVVHKERDDLTIWARCEEFRALERPIRVGTVGHLRLDKELREMLPGYYTILGDAEQSDQDPEHPLTIIRFYWHLTAEGAPLWVRELTQRFNRAGVSFRAKVLSNPNAYIRADAGVLYITHRDLERAMNLLPEFYTAISPHLRHTTPMLTKRLTRGLGVAEDPGDGRSFGQHRCQLVSEGLVRAFESGRTTFLDIVASIHERFVEEKLSIRRPWLNSESRERYVWPAA